MPDRPPSDSVGGADTPGAAPPPNPLEPRLFDQIHTAIARLRYSPRTEEA